MSITYSQEKAIRIAMAQIVCLHGDRSGNFVRIENAGLVTQNNHTIHTVKSTI